MKKIIVLGAGMVGRAMAIDLSTTFDVTSADVRTQTLQRLQASNIKTVQADLSAPQVVQNLIEPFDLVVGAVPGFMGFETLKAVIQTGKPVVDIAFVPQDPFLLDDPAKQNNVTAVVDCGVAPGMSNLILGFYKNRMKIESFECLVGGLPVTRTWPYEYKAPFSPIDVLEEYTRPARLVEHGQVVTRPALSEPELVDLEPVGTLEAFNTDGLRTLLRTMDIPFMKEKTLRYPGHIERMRMLRESGFLSKEPIEIDGQRVVPLQVTSTLLFPQWKLGDTEPEFTIMRIVLRGTENGQHREIVYQLFDTFDAKTGISSMARTTGFTSTAMAHLLANGDFSRKGICPPEFIGETPGCFDKVMQYLKDRQVVYHKIARTLGGDETSRNR